MAGPEPDYACVRSNSPPLPCSHLVQGVATDERAGLACPLFNTDEPIFRFPLWAFAYLDYGDKDHQSNFDYCTAKRSLFGLKGLSPSSISKLTFSSFVFTSQRPFVSLVC